MNKIISLVKLFIFIIILFYIFYGIDFNKLEFIRINYLYMLLSFFILMVSLSLLAFRWKIMLPKLIFKSAIESTFVRVSINNIFPAKLGEVAKILYLKKFYKVNFSDTLPLLIIDRVMDLICMLIVFIICFFIFNYKELDIEFLYIGMLGIFLSIFLLYLFVEYSKTIIHILRKKNRKFAYFFISTIKTLNSLSMVKLVKIFIISICIWYCYVYFLYFLIQSVNVNFGLKELMFVFAIITIASAVPLLPSGLGVTEVGLVFVFTKYGYTKEFALIFAIYYHIVRGMMPTILGLFFLFIHGLKIKEIFVFKKRGVD